MLSSSDTHTHTRPSQEVSQRENEIQTFYSRALTEVDHHLEAILHLEKTLEFSGGCKIQVGCRGARGPNLQRRAKRSHGRISNDLHHLGWIQNKS